MPSLVAQSINKSKGAAKPTEKTPQATKHVPAKKSLQAMAMEKAIKSSPKPVVMDNDAGPVTSPVRPAEATKRSQKLELLRAPAPLPAHSPQAPTLRTMPAYSPRVYSTPAQQMSPVEVEEKEEEYVPRRGMQARTQEQPRLRGRSKSGPTVTHVPFDVEAVTPVRQSRSVRTFLVRLLCAVVCAGTLYLGQARLVNTLELPTSLRTAELGQGFGTLKLLASSASDNGDIESFRKGLMDTLQDRYSEDLSVEELWATYLQLKRTNGQMTAAIGMLVGFIFAGIFM